MNFTDKLSALLAKATEGPWEAGHPISKEHYGVTAYDHTYAIPQDINDAELIAYLRNHAQEIINLVEAAEVMCGQVDGDDLEAEAKMVEALAALNKEQS